MQSAFSRLVHVSTTGALQARRFETSDPVSACLNGVSLRIMDILGRIFIAVMVLAALWTIPLSNIERESSQNVAAAVTSLRGGEEAIHKPQLPAVSLTFVGKHLTKLTEAGIENRLGEWAAFNHSPHVQVLDADPVVSAHQIGRHLVEVILPSVYDVFLYPGNADVLPVPPAASLGSTTEDALRLGKTSLVFARMLWVADTPAIGKSSKSVDPKINANCFTGRFYLGKLFVENQRNEVSPTRPLGDCNSCRLRLEFAAPVYSETAQPADNQVRVVWVGPGKLESRSRVFSGLLVALLFESRVSGFLVEKLHKCVIQMSQRLLNRHAGHFPQPCGLFLSFPFGQFSRSLVITNLLLPLLPRISPIPQRSIVGVATTPEDLGKLCLLGLNGGESKLVSNLHANNIYV